MDMSEIRRDNLSRLIEPFDTKADFARHYGVDPTYVSQLLGRHRGFGEKSARNMEKKLRLKPFALDKPLKDKSASMTAERADQLAENLAGKATPRSRRALEHIQRAVHDGRLSEKDVRLLEAIAERFLHGKND